MKNQSNRPVRATKLNLDDATTPAGYVRVRSGVKAGATSYDK